MNENFGKIALVTRGSRGIDLGFLMDVTKAYKNLDWRPSVNFKTWANTLSVK